MKTNFYVCPVCGNVIVKLVDSGVVPHCCGRPMMLLEENESDGLGEKHLPALHRVDECTIHVEVGEKPHPMSPDHYIQFILLESEQGLQVRFLKPDRRPTATFFCGRDKPTAVYEYCNLHGLWKNTTIPETKKCRTCCIH